MAIHETVYRLSDIIRNYERKDIRNSALYLKEVIETDNRSRANIVLVDNLLDKYRQEILNSKITIKLEPNEQRLYYYNPKLVCHVLYRNTELWRILLDINQMHSVTEFHQEYIHIMSPGLIDKIFTEIINLEEYTINVNSDEVNSARIDYEQYCLMKEE